jgi:hypothetical protein
MAITVGGSGFGRGVAGLSVNSDDNFGTTQITRAVRLADHMWTSFRPAST